MAGSNQGRGGLAGGRASRCVAALAGLALVVAACGSSTTTPSAPGASVVPPASGSPVTSGQPTGGTGTAVEITFWAWAPGIQNAVDAYNESQSEIHVTLDNTNAGNALYAVLNTALSTGTGVPDAVQIEYQHLPSFIVRGDLLNLAEYGAAEVQDQFVEWTWAQVSQGEGVFAYPQDAGPMIMMCNKALLDEHNVAIPTTWDEFKQAAADLHAADSNVYLSNFTADQGHFFGLLWQSGARPFQVDGQNVTVSLTSPEVLRVAELWDELLDSGDLSPIDTYTPDWNTALANGTIACWTAGAWGPSLIESAAPDLSGDWRVTLMPQWGNGGGVNGNYGGSTTAVPAKAAHPAEAERFARWLNTDPGITLELTAGESNLFPVTQATLENAEWSGFTSEFWGGETTHQTMAEAANQVDVSFGWSPFTDFVYTTYAEELTAVREGSISFEEAMQHLQDRSVQYAQDQGFTVQQ